jgi:hypothetical protein
VDENGALVRAYVHVKFTIGYPKIQNSKRILVADERPKNFVQGSAYLWQVAWSAVYVQILSISTTSSIPPYWL